ncbi:uncharacterized protein [Spinacia oleracea]|uniref:Endonuclease/exonuclease/phosphatase domain-containing protein n=1 Tax=Spinacia oleracea TaxID=3562 RepID=A0ABM3R920_SPIOL|nr:uncharacterized protein LOC130467585 [Spinacia oleracea]
MKICLWNVRGASKDKFIPHAWIIVEDHRPSILVMVETKCEEYRAREVMYRLRFDDCKVIPSTAKRGEFGFFGRRSETSYVERHAAKLTPPPPQTPWLVMGDLNEITSQADKQGGRPFRFSQCKDMNNFVDAAGLVDLGYDGCPFTWTNARDGAALIRERLDRALVNSPWLHIFPHTKVHHIPRTYSDHAPILISLDNPKVDGPSLFVVKKFEGRDHFLTSIKNWNQNVFGNLYYKRKRLLARINGIQLALANKYSGFLVNLERDLLKQLDDILNKERLIWAQKAGMNWRKYADYNTKYFHILAKIRKSKGKILTLQNDQGEWITDQTSLKSLAVNYFNKLLQTTHVFSSFKNSGLSPCKISDTDKTNLIREVTMEEVKSNLFSMDPIKCPGPDGIQAVFFQKHWDS